MYCNYSGTSRVLGERLGPRSTCFSGLGPLLLRYSSTFEVKHRFSDSSGVGPSLFHVACSFGIFQRCFKKWKKLCTQKDDLFRGPQGGLRGRGAPLHTVFGYWATPARAAEYRIPVKWTRKLTVHHCLDDSRCPMIERFTRTVIVLYHDIQL